MLSRTSQIARSAQPILAAQPSSDGPSAFGLRTSLPETASTVHAHGRQSTSCVWERSIFVKPRCLPCPPHPWCGHELSAMVHCLGGGQVSLRRAWAVEHLLHESISLMQRVSVCQLMTRHFEKARSGSTQCLQVNPRTVFRTSARTSTDSSPSQRSSAESEVGHWQQSFASLPKAPEDIKPRHALLEPTALPGSMLPADRSLAGYIGQAGGPSSPIGAGQPFQAPALQTGLVRAEQHARAPAIMPSQSMQSSGFPPQPTAPSTPQPTQHDGGQAQGSKRKDPARPEAPRQSQAVPDDMTVIPLDEGHQHSGGTRGPQAQPGGVPASTNTQELVRAAIPAAASHAGVQLGVEQAHRAAPGPHAETTTTAVADQASSSVGQAADANLEAGHSRPSWTHDAFHATARGSPSRSARLRHLQGLPDRPSSSEGVAGTTEDEVRHVRSCAVRAELEAGSQACWVPPYC